MKDTGKKIIDVIGYVLLVVLLLIVLIKYYPNTAHSLLDFKENKELVVHPLGIANDSNVYNEIYQLYPKSAGGSEVIYSSLDEGNFKIADNILNDMYEVPRFNAVELKNLTWKEDPYTDQYWRFMFYSFEPEKNLLFAGRESKDVKSKNEYNAKLLELVNSFIDNGMDEPNSWEDYHAVAFRTMTLTNIWWKLREQGALSEEDSTRILQALKVHGDFLAEESHYEPQHNHGINQAAALLVLSVNFPDMPGADEWQEIAKKRITEGSRDLIDEDGILVENSPYYHFYALEKYWEVAQYSEDYDILMDDTLSTKVNQMISYQAYILQPNRKIPLLGASLDRQINYNGVYLDIADTNPELKYVLTEGEQGKKPENLSIYYPTAGQTIMRSGWGKGDGFTSQTQVIFDVGEYRTKHSDLDALSFNLFGDGKALLPDAGLYSYDKDEITQYFRSTYAHNTVVVDGINQKSIGAVNVGEFKEEEGYTYQTAQHELYPGVSHKRALVLIEKNIVIVIDELNSNTDHNYEQMFHLFPEATISTEGLDLSVNDSEGEVVSIHQLIPEGISLSETIGNESSPKGLCTFEYKKTVPCYAISYKKQAANAVYVTVIEIGEHDKKVSYSLSEDEKTVHVSTRQRDYDIDVKITEGKKEEVSVISTPLPDVERTPVTFYGCDSYNVGDNEYSLTSEKGNNYGEIRCNAKLDLSNKNIFSE
jgi:hypothetical protein